MGLVLVLGYLSTYQINICLLQVHGEDIGSDEDILFSDNDEADMELGYSQVERIEDFLKSPLPKNNDSPP